MTKKFKIFVLFIWLLPTIGVSQNTEAFFSAADTFFAQHVNEGRVDYKSIVSSSGPLDNLLKMAAEIRVETSDADTYRAFWINAYNLAVIKGIINNYPTNSPLDDAGFFDKTKYSLGGKKTTLNDIEHKLLRANFKDARFHFVLVCGAIGCPPLISNAYLPSTLDTQLEVQTKKAINGSFIKVKKNKVYASKIMEWYKEDFTMNGKTEIDFINTYRTEKISNKAKLSYFDYDWNLNKQ